MTRILVLLLVFNALPALSHQAPSGWQYDAVCCSNKDCSPLRTPISAIEGGWYLAESGEIIPFSDSKIRDSKDGDFHRCVYQFGPHKGNTRCLYVPPVGF